ncbi:MAG: ribonuclease Y, partial [Kiritimatiellaeota bacterium]|nr:ribonuclease Y [Kiritimatiellota bacterium]
PRRGPPAPGGESEGTTKARRKELQDYEGRLITREENLDRKATMLDKKEENARVLIADSEARAEKTKAAKLENDRQAAQLQQRFQKLAGMTAEEARREILRHAEHDAREDIAGLLRRLQKDARDQGEREAQRIISQAVQRYSASHVGENMTLAITLESEEVKGRIIGREGRNIRSIEQVTGVSMLVDDTPEVVTISSFDPVRREVARLTIEELIADGRIHPARIEEVHARHSEDVGRHIQGIGEEALYRHHLQEAAPEVTAAIGRLHYRSSYTQNVLQHAHEVAALMGVLAAEMHLDTALARRVGLLHDIGKALDQSFEGPHALIGADLLRRNSEPPVVVNAVAAHHQEAEAESAYAVLCSAADAISSARPGARVESTDVYFQRLERLEAIANTFPGVAKSFALHAGREVRVIVEPAQVDDAEAQILARNISRKIEQDLQYPGQIRVIVIREKRCVEYAR